MRNSRNRASSGRSFQGSGKIFPKSGLHPLPGVARATTSVRATWELLDTLTGSGSGRRADRPDLPRLATLSPAELGRELGIGARAAERVEAAFELGRRAREPLAARPAIPSAAAVFELLAPDVRGLEQEVFVVLLLDGKHRLRRQELVSLGTLTTSLVHPREVFRPAVTSAAAAIVVAHNHPSGDPEPSAEDLAVTRRLVAAGHLLGIPVLDHVVLGEGRWVSLRERLSFDEAPTAADGGGEPVGEVRGRPGGDDRSSGVDVGPGRASG